MRGKDGVSLERAFESNFIEVDRIGEQNKVQAQEIAKIKMPDLNAANLDSATEMIKGTARSMGIIVEG